MVSDFFTSASSLSRFCFLEKYLTTRTIANKFEFLISSYFRCCVLLVRIRLPKDTQPGLLRTKEGGKKLMDLGLQFIEMEQIIEDAVESLKMKGYIS